MMCLSSMIDHGLAMCFCLTASSESMIDSVDLTHLLWLFEPLEHHLEPLHALLRAQNRRHLPYETTFGLLDHSSVL